MTDAYRAFGAAWQGGNGSANAYRYAGEYGYYRDSAAVEYVRARYLNVLQGRWMSADPLRFDAGDYNLYRYVGNEPEIARCGRSAISVHSHPTSVPGGSNRHQPPNCTKYGNACKAVYFTCYKSARHRLAVYCAPDDKCSCKGKTVKCKTLCKEEGAKLGSPAFPQRSWVCIIGHNGTFCKEINDCGCGQIIRNKPDPDNWMDWGASDCSTFEDGWRCVCPGIYKRGKCTGCPKANK